MLTNLKIRNSALFLLGLLGSLNCIANDWTGYGQFSEVQCFSANDSVVAECSIIGFTGSASDLTINYCGKAWGTLYLPDETKGNSTQVYSAVLMAFAAGKDIKVYTNGCHEGFPLIGGVRIKK